MRGARVVCSCLLVLAGTAPCRAEDKDNLARKAREVLKTHCDRCHGQRAEGGFGFVLDFPRLRKKLVLAPQPEKSRLYKRVAIDKDMPPEEDDDGKALPRPKDEDVAALRQWIEAGAPDFQAPAAPREIVSPRKVLERIAADLARQPKGDRPFLRYFTLTHLYNAGVPEDKLDIYRLALAKLVNSLSWQKALKAPEPIDRDRTVFRINLTHYGWNARTWERILALNPYGIDYGTKEAADVAEMAETPLAYVRGDWFVVRASQPPLYHDVLYPDMKEATAEKDLEKLVGVDVAANLRDRPERVARAGFGNSGVSQNNRLIERHDLGKDRGAYWKSYDFAANTEDKNLFKHPLGPGGPKGVVARGFVPDGGEIIFNLPNGLQAYLLVNAEGRRLDKGPTNIVLDPVRPDAAVVNGLSCMSCHDRGMIEREDAIRQVVDRFADKYKDDVEGVRTLYPGVARMREWFRADAQRFAAALEAVGGKVDKEGRIARPEPISALVKLFEQDLDLKQAAAEAGVQVEEFQAALKADGFPTELVVLGDSGGTVKRDAFIAAFGQLVKGMRLGRFLDPKEKPDPKVRPALPPPPKNPLRHVLPDDATVFAVAFAPDSRTLATGSAAGVVRFWDPITGREQSQLKEPDGRSVATLAYSPDGKRLAVLNSFGTLSLWDPARPAGPLWSETKHGDAKRNHGQRPLVFFPDGASLASGDWEGKVIVWNAATGAVRNTLDFGKKSFVLSLAISPDGKVLAAGTSAGPDQKAIHLLDMAGGKPLRTLKTFDVEAAFSPDGRLLADGQRFWDWKNGKPGAELEPGTWVSTLAAAFSPDSKVLAVGGFDPLLTGTVSGVSLWDAPTGRPGGLLEGAPGQCFALAFSPDGRFLASAGSKPQGADKKPAGEIRVWTLDPPRPPAGARKGPAPQGDGESDPVKKYYEKYKPVPRP